MISFKPLPLSGVYVVENFTVRDFRGIFIKSFHEEQLKQIGFIGTFKESYYSQSTKNVVRGMHFQKPPNDHEKLVYVTEGTILDVILDLRLESKTYLEYITVELTAFGSSVFIPKGCAHGFATISDTATVVYNVSSVYNPISDSGVLWNSFGFNWPIEKPILSERDQSFDSVLNFKTPF